LKSLVGRLEAALGGVGPGLVATFRLAELIAAVQGLG
jgi:hypothetical protein